MLKVFRRRAVRTYRGIHARASIRKLTAIDRQLGTAIGDAMRGKTSPAEREWIDRIETLRTYLNASTEELEFTDFGAGTGTEHRTEEQMNRGSALRRTVGEICLLTSRTPSSALVLFRLIRQLRPTTAVELGTSLGISGCYQAAAMRINGVGTLVTLEGADAVAGVAERNFASIELSNIRVVRGRFQDTLPHVLSSYPSVDYAFVDGHHHEAATIRYFNALLPALSKRGVVVFDDIRWSDGMLRAWRVICSNPAVRISIDMGSMGLVSISGGSKTTMRFTVYIN
jgi:predicted O-methyltransferase YrrM